MIVLSIITSLFVFGNQKGKKWDREKESRKCGRRNQMKTNKCKQYEEKMKKNSNNKNSENHTNKFVAKDIKFL